MSQEESEHNEIGGMKKGVDSKGDVMHIKCILNGLNGQQLSYLTSN